jgi:hypothetical protein
MKQPNSNYMINELIKMGHYDKAQKATDENVVFFDKQIEEQQDLFVQAQCAKMGLKPTHDNLFATAINTPKRRRVVMG